jgi:hypothetical protein
VVVDHLQVLLLPLKTEEGSGTECLPFEKPKPANQNNETSSTSLFGTTTEEETDRQQQQRKRT